MQSVFSAPERGPWGDSRWRGNCSGHLIRELVEHFQPKLFVDITEGSGTSRDVCHDLGIEYVGLDLHTGFDATGMSVIDQLPRPADVSFSHLPYGPMVDYTSVGTWESPDLKSKDLSKCSDDEFLELAQVLLENQRLATEQGGRYCTLIGDLRKNGTYRSYQADFIAMMPKTELESVVIKTQHNCVSDRRQYSGRFIPIQHEYLLIWKRSYKTMFQITLEKVSQLQATADWTWRNLVRMALIHLGGKASLEELYALIGEMPEAAARRSSNNHWDAKIRQVLQRHFCPVERGVWSLAS